MHGYLRLDDITCGLELPSTGHFLHLNFHRTTWTVCIVLSLPQADSCSFPDDGGAEEDASGTWGVHDTCSAPRFTKTR